MAMEKLPRFDEESGKSYFRLGFEQVVKNLRDGASNWNKRYGAIFLKNFKISVGIMSILAGVCLITWGMMTLVQLFHPFVGIAVMIIYMLVLTALVVTYLEEHLD